YAFSVSLLLTPLCCEDIHDVTPRVSALAGCDKTCPDDDSSELGAGGDAGTRVGTSPELICPDIIKIGLGPVLMCTGAICSVSSSN
ncbi:hypothetical protein Tco_0203564, partial [Tanacetum coccineum]